ncbi:oxysterol-binding protein-related protein 1D [Artemisia annua]|uniref:Oxysterol-binding protein-related protein 1D n=1 Tax=Artemisia annua TaxID=35608 RepID=A0A2U1KJ85_ARTAN|nr:oxysterol-binding protein-related protein 1D [Artemisia annua]
MKKVSHHPVIDACHYEGRGQKFWVDSNLKGNFLESSIQLDHVGVLTLQFQGSETFHGGNVNYSCKLKFKEHSLIDRNLHQYAGFPWTVAKGHDTFAPINSILIIKGARSSQLGIVVKVPQLIQPAQGQRVVQHGACLGTADEGINHELNTVLYTDSGVAGEAAAISMGLIMAKTSSEKATVMLVYAHETQEHKDHKILLYAVGVCMHWYWHIDRE